MIGTVVQTSFRSLRRDRGAFVMSFILPIGFFTIFGFVFGSMRGSSTPRVSVLVVDQDQTAASRSLVRGLLREPSLEAMTHSKATKENPSPMEYTVATAEAAVRSGDAPAALIIPAGFGAHPISFGHASGSQQTKFQILHDSADPVAAHVVAGMLEKTVMTSLPATMATVGSQYFDQEIGGLTPQQRKQMDEGLARLKQFQEQEDTQGTPAATSSTAGAAGGLVAVDVRDVVGEKKKSPMISYYAAGVGVMFLLFTASAAGGSLLDESESGALDRVLSARVTMTTLLAGKLLYSALLAFAQLTIMFLWAALVFHLDFFQHIPGFLVMTAITSFAVASFGMLLASVARTRGQLGAFSTLIILTMSALGGSMFPKFIMSDLMIKVGYFTFNSWAIEGYQKIFWRDEPISSLGPEAAVLVSAGVVLFLLARWFARKWEYA
ncbi:MAG TPA: ABC transporter permease [Acidobacteriaceae bacterium]|jgi:ABC-2 type transport system permease protein|nr:ABC transporter permease [Acidobacteriaceae bacterium]